MSVRKSANTMKGLLPRRMPLLGDFTHRLGAFWHECWRRMNIMRADSEPSGDGSLSRERTAERLRDEEAWSRMDDDGGPSNGRQRNQFQETAGYEKKPSHSGVFHE